MTLRTRYVFLLACLALASCASKLPPPYVAPSLDFSRAIPDVAYTSRPKDADATSRSAPELEAAGYRRIGILKYKTMMDNDLKFHEYFLASSARMQGADVFVVTEKARTVEYVYDRCTRSETRKTGSYEVANSRIDTYQTRCTDYSTPVPMITYTADLWRLRRPGPPPCCVVEDADIYKNTVKLRNLATGVTEVRTAPHETILTLQRDARVHADLTGE